MEPALGKQFKAQQLIQFAQLWQQSPYLQQYQFMKAIMELFDFHNTDQYLYSPQQVQQQQRGMLQQQLQIKALEMQGEDDMAARQSKRDLQRDVVKQLLK
jgi:hypothetical protein